VSWTTSSAWAADDETALSVAQEVALIAPDTPSDAGETVGERDGGLVVPRAEFDAERPGA
jgi:hypothetical protein